MTANENQFIITMEMAEAHEFISFVNRKKRHEAKFENLSIQSTSEHFDLENLNMPDSTLMDVLITLSGTVAVKELIKGAFELLKQYMQTKAESEKNRRKHQKSISIRIAGKKIMIPSDLDIDEKVKLLNAFEHAFSKSSKKS